MKRMNSKQKVSIVLRVLRGESLDEVSRTEEVTMADLSSWRNLFLAHGEQGLKRSPKGSKVAEYERVIGKLQMENELLKKKSFFQEKREYIAEMKDEKSPSTSRVYPMRMILDIAGLSSAAWYRKNSKGSDTQRRKPGPAPTLSDERIVDEIKVEIKNSKFHSEGYKKLYKRLKNRGILCGKNRVYGLMVENKLLAPQRPVKNGSARVHDGTITTTMPNRMWGTDGKYFWTQAEGQCWLFSVIDHCNDEILGWHTAKIGNRFAAMEPVKQAIKNAYGKIDRNICVDTGLFLRSDHGSQYDSNDFQNELKFLGLVHSPAFVRSPECNGVIERFHRTIQEQIFDLHIFENLAQAQEVIGKFMEEYNESWLIHRLGLMSPVQFRENFKKQKALNCA